MNNGLLYLGGLLTVILAALFGVPYFVDWNGYRGVFEEEASKVLSRDVRVGGAVNVRFLPTPYVRFEKVRIADPTGQTGDAFMRADSFTMRLAVAPLLRGALEANEIELSRPVLSLALDEAGSGNWASLQLKPAELPFIPQNVALHSVRFIDGAVSLYGPDGQAITRIEKLNGELAAETLKGPFKFAGRATWSGEERDIKFSTVSPDPEGKIKLKTSVRGLTSANSYAFDGALADLSSKPRFTGEVTAKLGLPRLEGAEGDAAASVMPGFDLKARVDADTAGATFEDVTLDVVNAAEPQVITGKASAVWSKEPRFDTALTAKWLDLDFLASSGGQSGGQGATFVKLRQLGLVLLQSLAGDSAASAKIDLEQVKLGGEVAGGLKIDAERIGGVMKIKDMKGGLPGGARFELSGDIKGDVGSRTFDGEGLVRGANLARLQTWMQKSGANIDLKAEGPFWIAGRLVAGANQVELTEAKAELAGHVLMGELKINDKDSNDKNSNDTVRRRIDVRLESSKLDTVSFFPNEAIEVERQLLKAFGLADEAVPAPQAAGGPGDGRQQDLSVRITAGELKHAGKIYYNVDASVVQEDGVLRMPSAKFQTAGGLAVVASGRVINSADQPEGTFSYELTAQTREAVKDATELFALSKLLPGERMEAVSSARVAGLVKLGARSKAAVDVSFDGIVNGAHIAGRAGFDAGFKSWRTAPSHFNAVVKSPDIGTALSLMGVSRAKFESGDARPTETTVVVSGKLAGQSAALFDIKSEGLQVTLNGTVQMPETGDTVMGGRIAINGRDVRPVLALAGLPAPGGLSGTAIAGTVDVSAKGSVIELASQGMMAGESRLTGRTTISKQAGGNFSVDADISADRLMVSGLLSWITGSNGTPAGVGLESEQFEPVWPEAAFDFDALSRISGDVKIRSGALMLTSELGIRDSTITAKLAPGKISVTELSGRAAGGTLMATAGLMHGAGGVSLDGKFKLGADLSALSQAADGMAAIEFSVTGRALSPATLISGLNGSGVVALNAARHPGPAAAVVSDASDSVFSGEMANDVSVVTPALVEAIASARVENGTRQIPITISGGDLKLDAFVIEEPQGSARVSTVVRLASLAVDSVWQVTALAAAMPPPPEAPAGWTPPVKGPLPPIAVVYTGKLDDLKQLAVAVDASELQRELSVRQMERKVEELEVLRRRDEERAKQEIERRKALEAERVKAVAAAAAAAAAAKAQRNNPVEVLPPVIPEDANAAAPTAPQEPALVPDPAVESAAGQPQEPAASSPSDAIVPQSENPAVAAPPPVRAVQPRSRPPRPAERPRRTTSDELNKALGGWP